MYCTPKILIQIVGVVRKFARLMYGGKLKINLREISLVLVEEPFSNLFPIFRHKLFFILSMIVSPPLEIGNFRGIFYKYFYIYAARVGELKKYLPNLESIEI